MGEMKETRKSIAYHLVAGAGTSGEVIVYNVSEGFTFTIDRVQVAFPLGTYFELEIQIMRGLEAIKPTTGAYTGEGFVIADITKEDLGSGEPIKIKYKNLSTTQVRECFILIEGYEK